MGATKVRQVAADPDFASLPKDVQDQLLVEAEAVPEGAAPAEAAPNWFTKLWTPEGSPGGGPQIKGNPVSAQDVSEFLPAAGAGIGAVVGNAPGAAAGGGAGELLRQLIRRAAGQPAATGITQRALGLDPNSPEAAVAGMGAEAAAGPIAEGAGLLLKWGKGALGRGAQRSFGNLLQPATQVDKEGVMELAKRMEKEGIAPALSTRAGQVKNAEAALADAQAKRQAMEASLANETVHAKSVADASIGAIPEHLPGGAVPATGKAQRSAANKAAQDVVDVLGSQGSGTGDVPFKVAQSEKRRNDAMLKSFYESGRENVPQGVQYTKKAADSWRHAIAQDFPEMGAANLRESELIDVTNLLKDAEARIQREGPIGAASEAAALGAGVAGRNSIPLMAAAKAVAGLGPISSTSAAVKRTAAKLLTAPIATRQAWIRMHDFFNTEQEPQQ